MHYMLMAVLMGALILPTDTVSYQSNAPAPQLKIIEREDGGSDVLERIAECESGNRHFNEDGTVVIGAFTPPEYGKDVGRYQISTYYHGKCAKKLGLDLYEEADNEEYARLLYEEQGTRPWKASRNCWSTQSP